MSRTIYIQNRCSLHMPHIHLHVTLTQKLIVLLVQQTNIAHHVYTFHTAELFVQPQHPQYQDNNDDQGKEKQQHQDDRHSYGSTGFLSPSRSSHVHLGCGLHSTGRHYSWIHTGRHYKECANVTVCKLGGVSVSTSVLMRTPQ